jgi:hypothetical protein
VEIQSKRKPCKERARRKPSGGVLMMDQVEMGEKARYSKRLDES